MKRISIKKFRKFVSMLAYWRLIHNGETLEWFSDVDLQMNRHLVRGNSIPRAILKRTKEFELGDFEPRLK